MALLHELKKVLLTVLEFQSNPCSRIIQWLAGQSHYQFNNNVQINKSTSTCRGLSLELEHTPEIYKVYLCSQTKMPTHVAFYWLQDCPTALKPILFNNVVVIVQCEVLTVHLTNEKNLR